MQNKGKGVVFATTDDDRETAETELSDIGKVQNGFEYLGVEYDVNRQGNRRVCRIKPKRYQKILRRLRRIRLACQTKYQQATMVKKLVMPIVRWGGQWRTNRQGKGIALKVEKCIIGKNRIYAGRSPALMWMTQLVPEVHPDYVQDVERMTSRLRRITKAAMHGGQHVAKGRLDEVCGRWGWSITDRSGTTFNTQLAELKLGECCKATFMKHAKVGWQHWMLCMDNRGGHPRIESLTHMLMVSSMPMRRPGLPDGPAWAMPSMGA